MARNPDGSQAVYFAAILSVPDQTPANLASVQPLLSAETWTSAWMTFTDRGGAIALQNPNATAVDVVLQVTSAFSSLDEQTTVTLPPGALHVYPAAAQSARGFRAFAPLPVRVLGMGNPPPLAGLIVASPLPAFPPEQKVIATPSMVSFSWRTGAAAPSPVTVNLAPNIPNIHNANLPFHVTAPAAPFSVTPTREPHPPHSPSR